MNPMLSETTGIWNLQAATKDGVERSIASRILTLSKRIKDLCNNGQFFTEDQINIDLLDVISSHFNRSEIPDFREKIQDVISGKQIVKNVLEAASTDALCSELIVTHSLRVCFETICGEGSQKLKDNALNFLRFLNFVDRISYNSLHEEHRYLFMDRKSPNIFTTNTVFPYTNGSGPIIKGKDVVVLGSGYGSDDIAFLRHGAKSVRSVDDSAYAQKRLKERKNNLHVSLSNKLIMTSKPTGMIAYLESLVELGTQVDTIYGNSVLHYFDNPAFVYVLELVRRCLKPNGYLAFAIKLPRSDYHGEAIGLIKDERTTEDERMKSRVFQSTWLNSDGQVRHFRDREELERQVQNSNKNEYDGFKLSRRSTAEFNVENYDTEGSTQPFGFMLFKKVEN